MGPETERVLPVDNMDNLLEGRRPVSDDPDTARLDDGWLGVRKVFLGVPFSERLEYPLALLW